MRTQMSKLLDMPWRKILHSRSFRGLIYFFLGFIAFVLLLDKIIMPLYTKHGHEVRLPDVTGLSLEEAEILLRERGFRMVKDKEIYDSRFPKGYVVAQNPRPNAIVKKGRRIYLTISLGSRRVAVPDLIGKSDRDAELTLHSLGLEMGRKDYDFSEYYPRGVVMAQSIPSGDTVEVGTLVDVVVSLGSQTDRILVPNLVGKSLKEASEILMRTGLALGSVEYQIAPHLLPETVIEQSLRPGTEVDFGTAIDLIVSQIEEEEVEADTTEKD